MSQEIIKFDEFPSNSHKSKQKAEEIKEKKVEKVVTSKPMLKKKSIFSKMSEAFVGDDSRNVGEYLLYDILIPTIKSMFLEMITSGSEKILYGDERRPNRTYRDRGVSRVSYSSYYNSPGRSSHRRSPDRGIDMDDIILGTRDEAEEVLSALCDIVETYEQASVSDLHELLGITSNYTDRKYGWDNLSSACVRRTRDGYLIDLPRTIVLP